ncbi:hypothetical protein L3X38_027092 [Prunus dulcis]|uniref:Uncharacterized protein n=1 Tax=Prunus dulcis TaxID=3755 RepID=A0AAD4YZY7_PRUDU|nr:hypothetical protein L3X38_027092 [Prunus dulcis]
MARNLQIRNSRWMQRKGDTTSQQKENELDSSDDDGLPPLEANTNRLKPVDWKSGTESNSDSDFKIRLRFSN